ncbi:hypothetical protein LTR94_025039 [Friedmanniomyces endolithicus]|nr:hypothetical protein LTR94_025039 [Friedmanniomyces endolithicus]
MFCFTDQLIHLLQERGHQGAVASALDAGDGVALRSRIMMKLGRRRFAKDKFRGYPVYRSWFPDQVIDQVARDFKADVVVVQNHKTVPITQRLQSDGFPTVLYFRNVEMEELYGDINQLASQPAFIANSQFTASAYRKAFGIECVIIPPLVSRAKYQTESTRENVTFINPVPKKGVDIAIDIASACPDIPFVFVEGWKVESEEGRQLRAKLGALKNVTLHPRTDDMRSVYAKAKIVLAPSIWEEAWGRVATEAQISGIPVIGSTRGGLPEAIGAGGVPIDIESDRQVWVAEVRRLWDNAEEYARAVNAAKAYSLRDEINPTVQIDRFIEVLETARAQRV